MPDLRDTIKAKKSDRQRLIKLTNNLILERGRIIQRYNVAIRKGDVALAESLWVQAETIKGKYYEIIARRIDNDQDIGLDAVRLVVAGLANEVGLTLGNLQFNVKFTPGDSWNNLATRLPTVVRGRLAGFMNEYLDNSGRYIQKSLVSSYQKSGIEQGTGRGAKSIQYQNTGKSMERASIFIGIRDTESASTQMASAQSRLVNSATQYMPALEFGTHRYPKPGRGPGGPNLGRLAWWLSFRSKGSFTYDPGKPIFAQYNEKLKQARAYNRANKDTAGFQRRDTRNLELIRLLALADSIRRKGTRKFAFMQKVIRLEALIGGNIKGDSIRDILLPEYQRGVDTILGIAMEKLLNDVAQDLGGIKTIGVAKPGRGGV